MFSSLLITHKIYKCQNEVNRGLIHFISIQSITFFFRFESLEISNIVFLPVTILNFVMWYIPITILLKIIRGIGIYIQKKIK